MAVSPLLPEALVRCCDTSQFEFETTAELPEVEEVLGQERAVEAVRFGVGMAREGYNMFALGGSSRDSHAIIQSYLEKHAAGRAVPDDWCYVHNFAQPAEPVALSFPAGRGCLFRNDMAALLEELQSAIPATFESEEYRTRKQLLDQEFQERQEKIFNDTQVKAREQGIAMFPTPTGFSFAPLADDEVMKPEQFKELPEEERGRIEARVQALQQELRQRVQAMPLLQREFSQRLKELNREVTEFAVNPLLEELRQRYADLPAVVVYLQALSTDVITNAKAFLVEEGGGGLSPAEESGFTRYQVNLLVDHTGAENAPVVYEDLPGYANLTGRIEHQSQFGALSTDFTLIKPGALHRANGGYLVVDAGKVLLQPFAWEGLKRALRARELRIEPAEQLLSLMSTVTLQPQPIPLDIKLVMIGDRRIYYLLSAYDPEFPDLVKVAVDFNDDVDRSRATDAGYAALIGTIARREGTLHLSPGGVARMIEHAARLSGDSEKLTSHISRLSDLLLEADYQARQAALSLIGAAEVQAAIDAQIHRQDRLQQRVQEQVLRGTVLIDTAGARVGQINGLSVISLGGFSFGQPSRITARVRLGSRGVVDIEREVELGGPLHSKGVLILANYLGARFAPDKPLSLSASLVFEQSYGGVDGDSASSAELYALLSALSDLPLRQSLAVTGSVNQFGQVQAIGGVNEKIEGFFDICSARGLSGDQGVLIPAANAKHLMLRQDVVDAVAAGQFQIYGISSIDEGIELLTGYSAGQADEQGEFPDGSVNHRVARRINELVEARRSFGRGSSEDGNTHPGE
ncbi:MAG: AAA family ATPase [Gammaproteobacteria bacterium]|nr:AAA family ATPase [Gammaproteobacteria bacterium]